MIDLTICGYGTVFQYKDRHSDIVEATSTIIFKQYNKDVATMTKNKFLLPMKYNHNQIIGYWNHCKRTDYGIFLIGNIHHQYANIYKTVLDSKMFLSIAGYVKKARKKYICNSVIERYLEEIEIVEVSLTRYPSNNLCGCIKYKI